MPRNNPYTLEICVENPDTLTACAATADRVELCSALDIGGLTPSIGLMEQSKASGVETHVLIRPHGGDFTMSPTELATAVADIRAAKAMELKGVVIGAERAGALDRRALDAMVHAADGMDITLHRVIDVLDDPVAAIEVAIEYAMVRILTSGAAMSAAHGIAGLKRLHTSAAGRIDIMAGAGINSGNIRTIMDQTAITSFHASCSAKARLDQRYVQFGFGDATRTFDPHEMARLAQVLKS
ncbi:copper homeostasis protein CutC [Octadecabacter sp. G9-8]|uniref:PF03932 family protein CutC n=1 Tax=Octadecabacter dasysiphoniae TaxID=2909341 RepID=A0ABS9CTU4_9RHOB|nr:copper homeostasis protein CutC [Octadecabacter dasysiphoniae]MCF2870657.1 copper homeostasis protein CutC [Octadecabacter dasysiphoniae]